MEGSAFEASRGAHPSLLPTIPATLRPSLPSKKLLHSPISLLFTHQAESFSLTLPSKKSSSPSFLSFLFPLAHSFFQKNSFLPFFRRISFLSTHEGGTLSLSFTLSSKNHLSLSFLSFTSSFLSKRVFLPFFAALSRIFFFLFSFFSPLSRSPFLPKNRLPFFFHCYISFSLMYKPFLSLSLTHPFFQLSQPRCTVLLPPRPPFFPRTLAPLPSLSIHPQVPLSLFFSLMTVEGTVEEGVESERSWGVGTVGSAQ